MKAVLGVSVDEAFRPPRDLQAALGVTTVLGILAFALGGVRGTITIASGLAEGGDEVWIAVADTGCGINAAVLKRVFDPLFTTKPLGKGTGLGLSLSYGIVKKHGGRIEVMSEPDSGSAFRICVPIKSPGGTP